MSTQIVIAGLILTPQRQLTLNWIMANTHIPDHDPGESTLARIELWAKSVTQAEKEPA